MWRYLGLVFSIKPWCAWYYFLRRYLTVLYSVSNHGAFGTIFCDVASRSCIQYQTMVRSVLFSVTLPHGLVFSIKPWCVRYYFLRRYLTVLYSVSNHGAFGTILCDVTSRSCIQYQTMVRLVLFSVTLPHGLVFSIKPWCVRYYFLWRYLTVLYSVSNHGAFGTIFCDVTSRSCIQCQTMVRSVLFSVTLPHGLVFSIKPWCVRYYFLWRYLTVLYSVSNHGVRYYFLWRYLTVLYSVSNHGEFGTIFCDVTSRSCIQYQTMVRSVLFSVTLPHGLVFSIKPWCVRYYFLWRYLTVLYSVSNHGAFGTIFCDVASRSCIQYQTMVRSVLFSVTLPRSLVFSIKPRCAWYYFLRRYLTVLYSVSNHGAFGTILCDVTSVLYSVSNHGALGTIFCDVTSRSCIQYQTMVRSVLFSVTLPHGLVFSIKPWCLRYYFLWRYLTVLYSVSNHGAFGTILCDVTSRSCIQYQTMVRSVLFSVTLPHGLVFSIKPWCVRYYFLWRYLTVLYSVSNHGVRYYFLWRYLTVLYSVSNHGAFGTIFCDVTSRSCIQYQTMERSVLFSVTLPHGLVFSIKPWCVRYYFLRRYLTVLYSVLNHGALGTIFCDVTSRSCIQYQTMVRSVLFSVTLPHGLVFSIKPWRSVLFSVTLPHGLVFSIKPWCVRYYFLWRYLTVLYSVSNHGAFGTILCDVTSVLYSVSNHGALGTIFCDVTSRSCIQYQTMVRSVLFSVTLPHGLVFSIKPWCLRYYFLWRYLTVLYSVSNHGAFGTILCDVTSRSCIQYQTMVRSVLFSVTLPHGLVFSIKPWCVRYYFLWRYLTVLYSVSNHGVRYYFLWRYLTVLYSVSNHGAFGTIFCDVTSRSCIQYQTMERSVLFSVTLPHGLVFSIKPWCVRYYFLRRYLTVLYSVLNHGALGTIFCDVTSRSCIQYQTMVRSVLFSVTLPHGLVFSIKPWRSVLFSVTLPHGLVFSIKPWCVRYYFLWRYLTVLYSVSNHGAFGTIFCDVTSRSCIQYQTMVRSVLFSVTLPHGLVFSIKPWCVRYYFLWRYLTVLYSVSNHGAFGTIFCDVTSRSCIQYQTMVRSVLFSVTLPHGLVFSIKPWCVRYYFLWRYLTVLYSVSNHGGTIFCDVTSRSCIQYQTMVRSVLFSVTLPHGLVFSIKPWCVRYYFLWRYLTVLYSVSNHGAFGTIFCDVTSRSCIQYQTMVRSVLFSVTLPHGLVFSIKPWCVRYYFLWRYLTVLYSVSNHGEFGTIFCDVTSRSCIQYQTMVRSVLFSVTLPHGLVFSIKPWCVRYYFLWRLNLTVLYSVSNHGAFGTIFCDVTSRSCIQYHGAFGNHGVFSSVLFSVTLPHGLVFSIKPWWYYFLFGTIFCDVTSRSCIQYQTMVRSVLFSATLPHGLVFSIKPWCVR